MSDYKNFKVSELREIARSRGLKGWYRLRKSDLISFIKEEEEKEKSKEEEEKKSKEEEEKKSKEEEEKKSKEEEEKKKEKSKEEEEKEERRRAKRRAKKARFKANRRIRKKEETQKIKITNYPIIIYLLTLRG